MDKVGVDVPEKALTYRINPLVKSAVYAPEEDATFTNFST